MAREVVLRFKGDTKDLEAALKRVGVEASVVEKASQGMGIRMVGAGEKLSSVGGRITRDFSIPVGLAAAAAGKLAVEFESSMTQMQSLVGISRDQVQAWSKDLLDLGPALGKAPAELSEGLYFITSSGIEAGDALDVLKESAKASAVGLGETQVVADAVTSAMNAYGKENLSAARATDILLATVKEGKGEPEDLAESIGRVIAPAQSLGVEFEEVGAALASMTLVGLDADEATTALRGALMALTNPTMEQSAALSAMGLSLEGVRKVIAERGLLAGFQMLRDKMGDNVEAGTALFGNVRALNGFMIMTGENAGNTARIFDSLASSTGEVDRAFEVVSETSEFKLRQSLAELQATGIQVGAQIMPAVLSIANGVADVAEAFAKLDPALQKTLLTFVALTAAAGPLLKMGGNLVTMTGQVIQGFQKIGLAGSASFAAAAVVAFGLVQRLNEISEAAAETRQELTGLVPSEDRNDLEAYSVALEKVGAHLADLDVEADRYDGIGGFFKEVFELLPMVEKDAARLAGEVRGNAEAFEDLARAQLNIQDNLNITSNRLGITTKEVERLANAAGIDLTQAYQDTVPKLQAAYQVVKDSGPKTMALAESNEVLASKVSSATEKIDAFKDALDAALGITLDADEATLRFQEKLQQLAEEVEENGRKAGFFTEKERAVQSAIIDVVRAAQDEVDALARDGRITADAAVQKQELVKRLQEVKQKFPELAPAIDSYIRKLDEIPVVKETEIKAEVEKAILDVRRLKQELASLPNNVFSTPGFDPASIVQNSITHRASGGPVTAGKPYLVGEEGPELVFFGASGMVYPADITDALLRGGVIPRAGGGLVGPTSRDVLFEEALAGTARSTMHGQNNAWQFDTTGGRIFLEAFLQGRDPASELDRVGRAYAELALAVDETTAKELLSQRLTAQQYEEAAGRIIRSVRERQAEEIKAQQEAEAERQRAAQERERAAEELRRAMAMEAEKRREIEDVQFEFGVLSKERYLQILDQRIAAEEVFTREWASLVRQRNEIAQKGVADQRTAHLADLAARDPRVLDLLDRGLGAYLPTGSASVSVSSGAVQITVQVDGSNVDENVIAERLVQKVNEEVIPAITQAIRARG